MSQEANTITNELDILVESGSFFGTPEYRRSRGWNDSLHNKDRIISFQPDTNVATIEVSSTFDWKADGLQSGSQAGLYYFGETDLTWIKFVKERLTKGVFLVFAYQIEGVPQVIGKIDVPDNNNHVLLRVSISSDHIVTGQYRFSSSDAWSDMVRGVGWKLENEVVISADEERDTHLPLDDERGKQIASFHFPDKGLFKLVTEQWKTGANEWIEFKVHEGKIDV